MKTLVRINQAILSMNLLTITLAFVLMMSISSEIFGNISSLNTNNNIPGYFDISDDLRPSFENMAVWRLQLRVKTGGIKNANTDNNVYGKFTSKSSSKYYLDRAGDDREKNKVNTYDILDQNIQTIKDIKMVQLMIEGTDGWCVQSVEILVNNIEVPVFSKKYKTCQWLDGNDHEGPSLYISGSEIRQYAGWKYTSKNKSIWLPPTIIRRNTLEEMVESYIGHMMNDNENMRNLEFGKKNGRAYVEAKKAGSNRLQFDLDLKYKINNAPDPEVDVDFDLVISCQNNKLNLNAESVKGKLNIPIATDIIRIFKSGFGKMDLGNINFGNSNVPLCPKINITNGGDILLSL